MLIIAEPSCCLSCCLLHGSDVTKSAPRSAAGESAFKAFQGPSRPGPLLPEHTSKESQPKVVWSGFPNSTDQELRGKPLIDKFPWSCFGRWPSSEMVHTWFSEQSSNGCVYYLDFLECLNTQHFVPPPHSWHESKNVRELCNSPL